LSAICEPVQGKVVQRRDHRHVRRPIKRRHLRRVDVPDTTVQRLGAVHLSIKQTPLPTDVVVSSIASHAAMTL
jgi:hypothetical protein